MSFLIQAVYPRVYGGTSAKALSTSTRIGLSPRVRGNRLPRHAGDVVKGSIPACTGEPPCAGVGGGCQEVYPRVYGGTA